MRALLVPAAVMAMLAIGFQVVVARRTRAGLGELRAGMQSDLRRGGLQPLLRARVVGVRLAVADPGDAEIAATLAYLGSRLATSYGLPFDREAESEAGRAERGGAGKQPAAVAARALLALRAGRRAEALALAAGGGPALEPYLALALARSWSGALVETSRTLEAARVIAPDAGDGRLAWAEARIDLGDAALALGGLEEVLRAAPDETEALLLVAEALDALGRALEGPQARALEAACTRDERVSSVLRAGCALERATRARLAGDQPRALEEARAAATTTISPRLAGRTAQLLGQLGAIDEADALLGAARKLGDESMPALAWAAAAVTLGRGQLALPAGLQTGGSVNRVLAVRAAFASGGTKALDQWLGTSPADPEVRLYLAMARGSIDAGGSPVADYLAGLRARLAGDLPTAAVRLRGALEGHGDACRAAGEYVATLRALGRELDLRAFDPLRRSNARCVHLTPAALAPASPPARKGR
jgi:hypothetical protein